MMPGAIKQERLDTLVDIECTAKPPVDTSTSSKSLACTYPDCTFRAVRAWDLRTHERAHERTDAMTCAHDGCAYRTLKREKLRQHQRTHTGEKPFPCAWDGCAFRAAQKGNLKTHMRTHTGEEPFRCRICPGERAFKQQTLLKTHFRIHHPLEKVVLEGSRGDDDDEMPAPRFVVRVMQMNVGNGVAKPLRKRRRVAYEMQVESSDSEESERRSSVSSVPSSSVSEQSFDDESQLMPVGCTSSSGSKSDFEFDDPPPLDPRYTSLTMPGQPLFPKKDEDDLQLQDFLLRRRRLYGQ